MPVIFMNPVAKSLTGWKQEDVEGRPVKEVFHIINEESRKPAEDPVTRVLQEGVVVGLANHTVLIAKDGTERPIDDSGAPIRDDKGNMLGVVLVFLDISEPGRPMRWCKRVRKNTAPFSRTPEMRFT